MQAYKRIKRKTPPIEYSGRRKDLVWVQPTLIAEVVSSLDA
ncbi:hypothetical protein [Rhizobium leguminosarum]